MRLFVFSLPVTIIIHHPGNADFQHLKESGAFFLPFFLFFLLLLGFFTLRLLAELVVEAPYARGSLVDRVVVAIHPLVAPGKVFLHLFNGGDAFSLGHLGCGHND